MLAICARGDGEWMLVHRCTGCRIVHLNRIAGDDNLLLLTRLAVRPLAQPPFRWSGWGGLRLSARRCAVHAVLEDEDVRVRDARVGDRVVAEMDYATWPPWMATTAVMKYFLLRGNGPGQAEERIRGEDHH